MEFAIGYFPTHDAATPGALAGLVLRWIPSAGAAAVEPPLQRWKAAIADQTREA